MRVLVDTNVWRYLVDADTVERVANAVKHADARVLACPAVVYEVMRLEDPDLRDRLVRVLCRRRWTRMMPEAYEESNEFRHEIERLRPMWCRSEPDLRTYHQLRADWAGATGFWLRARRDTVGESRRLAELEGRTIQQARAESAQLRSDFKDVTTFDTFDPSSMQAFLVAAVPGWDGDPLEPWRVNTMYHYEHVLLRPGSFASAEHEWLSPWLDLQRMAEDRVAWTRFFLYDTEASRLPRNWLRWAFRMLQATRTTTPGTPVDNQVASYLVDADVLVTGDKAFVAVTNRLRRYAPLPIAQAVRVPSPSDAAETLVRVVTEGATPASGPSDPPY